jgi:hypothetical protein
MSNDHLVLEPSGKAAPLSWRRRIGSKFRKVLAWGKGFYQPTNLLAFCTMLIIGFQLVIMRQQANILQIQQEEATRPTVEFVPTANGTFPDHILWSFRNRGPYDVVNVSVRFLHFKKFVNLGWHATVSGGGFSSKKLRRNQSVDIVI